MTNYCFLSFSLFTPHETQIQNARACTSLTHTHKHTRQTTKNQTPSTVILNSSDFDYLYTKGSNNAPIDRSSLLLKFDPLLGAPVPVNLQQEQEQALLNILGSNQNNRVLSPTLEELETSVGNNQSLGLEASAKETAKKLDFKPPVDRTKVSFHLYRCFSLK